MGIWYFNKVVGGEVPTPISPIFDSPTGIGWDNNYLWVSDKDHGKVSKVDTSVASPSVIQIVDLEPYGINQANGGTRSIECHNGRVYVTGMFSEKVASINASTGNVVGIAQCPSGDKVVFCCIDSNTNTLWVNHQNGSGSSRLSGFSISNLESQFPTPTTPDVTYGPFPRFDRFGTPRNEHFENIIFAGGYIWAGNGAFYTYAQLHRIDPTDGSITTYENGSLTNLDFFWGVHYAHGSIWCSSNANRIYRFDPATFPSVDPTVITTTASGAQLLCMLTSDATSIWVSTWSNASSARLIRISVGLGTEAEIAKVTFTPATPFTTIGRQITYDGSDIWVTTHFGDNGIARCSTGIGTEAFNYSLLGP